MPEPFLVLSDAATGEVCAWSAKRPVFEPSGWMVDLRAQIRAAVAALPAPDHSTILSALCGSASSDFCDAENVLIYNLGPGHFGRAATDGLRFERAYDPPVPPEQLTPADGLHYMACGLAPLTAVPRAWSMGDCLLSWPSVPIEPPTEMTKPATIWHALRCAAPRERRAARPESVESYGLRLTLGVPPGKVAPLRGSSTRSSTAPLPL